MSTEWTDAEATLPAKSGYYLAVHIMPSLRPHLVVSQLWFNPDSVGSRWWGGRGYLDRPAQHAVEVRDVTHWAPMPEPPVHVELLGIPNLIDSSPFDEWHHTPTYQDITPEPPCLCGHARVEHARNDGDCTRFVCYCKFYLTVAP